MDERLDENQKAQGEISELEVKARVYRFLADFFNVLANPTRLQILELLAKGKQIQKDSRKIPEYKVREGLYKFLSELLKILSSPTNIEILDLLYSRGQRPVMGFSKIVSDTKKKPAKVSYYLKKLIEYNLIEKVEKANYQMTEIGVFVLTGASAANIIGITEKAIEIGRTKGYVI